MSDALSDSQFMKQALEAARHAAGHDDVPVGCVLVRGGELLAVGENRREVDHDPTAHAEVVALRAAAQRLGHWRMDDVTAYVTLEPCVMCAGALVAARLRRLVFGARDLRFGGVRSKFRLADSELLNHRVDVVEGVCAAECLSIVKGFFDRRR